MNSNFRSRSYFEDSGRMSLRDFQGSARFQSVNSEMDFNLPDEDVKPVILPSGGLRFPGNDGNYLKKCWQLSLKLQFRMMQEQRDTNNLIRQLLQHAKSNPMDNPNKLLLPLRNFAPATTPEELEKLAADEDVVRTISLVSELTLTKSLTKMAKILMTRDLCLQYSLTGLGAGRKPCKLAFRPTTACQLMERAVRNNPEFSTFSEKEINRALAIALKSSTDWDGHRSRRHESASNSDGLTPSMNFSNSSSRLSSENSSNKYPAGSLDLSPLPKKTKFQGVSYHVLLDTNFIRVAEVSKVDLFQGLSKCLNSKCALYLYVTDCIKKEMEMNQTRQKTALRLIEERKIMTISCKHPACDNAEDCIVESMGNKRFNILATCDKEIKTKVRSLAHVNILTVGQQQFVIERKED